MQTHSQTLSRVGEILKNRVRKDCNRNLEMKDLEILTGIMEASYTNRIARDGRERIPVIKDTIEEIDTSIKKILNQRISWHKTSRKSVTL